nr:MAG TPA: hypothetical protein [Caudoviricetes sp.]
MGLDVNEHTNGYFLSVITNVIQGSQETAVVILEKKSQHTSGVASTGHLLNSQPVRVDRLLDLNRRGETILLTKHKRLIRHKSTSAMPSTVLHGHAAGAEFFKPVPCRIHGLGSLGLFRGTGCGFSWHDLFVSIHGGVEKTAVGDSAYRGD